ncbi:MAG: hypothetical protein ACOC1P_02655 [Minisyncoccales bacterium]
MLKKITENCFANVNNGKIVFFRRHNENEKPIKMTLNTIDDAISQCYHILDKTFVEVVDIYNVIPEVKVKGELNEMREILFELQEEIKTVAENLEEETNKDFSHISEKFSRARNEHKVKIRELLKMFEGKDLSIIAEAHMEAAKRVEQLRNIIKGIFGQIRALEKIKEKSERRITKAYEELANYEIKLRKAKQKGMINKKELERIVNNIAGEKANKVLFAFDSLEKESVLVNPYFERIKSKEVQDLRKIKDYYSEWKKGKRKSEDFIKLISKARQKLKRMLINKKGFKNLEFYKERKGDVIG